MENEGKFTSGYVVVWVHSWSDWWSIIGIRKSFHFIGRILQEITV